MGTNQSGDKQKYPVPEGNGVRVYHVARNWRGAVGLVTASLADLRIRAKEAPVLWIALDRANTAELLAFAATRPAEGVRGSCQWFFLVDRRPNVNRWSGTQALRQALLAVFGAGSTLHGTLRIRSRENHPASANLLKQFRRATLNTGTTPPSLRVGEYVLPSKLPTGDNTLTLEIEFGPSPARTVLLGFWSPTPTGQGMDLFVEEHLDSSKGPSRVPEGVNILDEVVEAVALGIAPCQITASYDRGPRGTGPAVDGQLVVRYDA